MNSLRSFLSRENALVFGWENYSISVLDDPKRALTAHCNEAVVGGLVRDLQIIANESFGTELEDQSQDGVREHVVNTGSLALLHDHEKVLGFASSKTFREEEIFYLHGVAVAKNFKSKGGGLALTRTLMEMSGMMRIAFTTQNPIMFCLLKSFCASVYPDPRHKDVPQKICHLGPSLISGRPGTFDAASFVANEIYERCLYDRIPDSRDPAVNSWFAESLGIMNGRTTNAFLLIGDRQI
jgi:ribosomal protein S18 acetylase RimI-like enzyme